MCLYCCLECPIPPPVRPVVTVGEDSSTPHHPEVVTAQEIDTGNVITSSHDSHMLPSMVYMDRRR